MPPMSFVSQTSDSDLDKNDQDINLDVEAKTPLLQMNRINKSFLGVQALLDVDLALFRGELFAWIGKEGVG